MDFCKHRIMDKCQKDNRPCIFSDECFEPEEIKPQTNADRIRAMSDEELARWLEYEGGGACAEMCGWLNWLQQPAEDIDDGA